MECWGEVRSHGMSLGVSFPFVALFLPTQNSSELLGELLFILQNPPGKCSFS
jgi:uncharacterized protein (DUF1919 family)